VQVTNGWCHLCDTVDAKLLRGGGKENVTKRNQRNKETALHKDTKVEQGELEIGTELFKSPTRK